jgi:putative ABC transport system permease protein
MTRRQWAGTILVEAATTGILGGAFGVLLGLAFVGIAVDTLARLTGLPLRVVAEPVWWLLAFVGGIALAMTASAFPILRSSQFSPAEAVRYE